MINPLKTVGVSQQSQCTMRSLDGIGPLAACKMGVRASPRRIAACARHDCRPRTSARQLCVPQGRSGQSWVGVIDGLVKAESLSAALGSL